MTSCRGQWGPRTKEPWVWQIARLSSLTKLQEKIRRPTKIPHRRNPSAKCSLAIGSGNQEETLRRCSFEIPVAPMPITSINKVAMGINEPREDRAIAEIDDRGFLDVRVVIKNGVDFPASDVDDAPGHRLIVGTLENVTSKKEIHSHAPS